MGHPRGFDLIAIRARRAGARGDIAALAETVADLAELTGRKLSECVATKAAKPAAGATSPGGAAAGKKPSK
jgi:hypothetical protein